MTTLRVAFVGTGMMARLHLLALARVRTPHIVAGVHDANLDAGRQFAGLARATAYATLDDLLSVARPHVVHVCTPAGSHFEPARRALLAGAHVYVEKPLVETAAEADELLTLAERQGLLVCAGHQQVRDPAYRALLGRVRQLGDIVQVDSDFAFRPVGAAPGRAGAHILAAQLLDIVPHPLYTLVDALERAGSDPSAIEVASVAVGPTELHAVLRADERHGRLAVSLRARPVASRLSMSGTGGTLTADFLRTSLVGAANAGTTPVEKAANPIVEAWQLAVRSIAGVARRVLRGGEYPGLVELIGEFYAAVASGGPSPLAPEHLRRVTALYQELADKVRGAAEQASVLRRGPQPAAPDAPVVVVTGARGFFGREIAKHLARLGYRVRGVSRSPDEANRHVHEWVRLDLSRSAPAGTFAGAEAVVHAAAESAGSYDAHQRNSIDATRNVLQGMAAAGVSRLVYVSSLSVLRPPRTPWERQDERTPLVRAGAREFGAYVWGKTEAERLLTAEAPQLGIETRILRPAALVDWSTPELPGLIGRRLFGQWHLGFGRPGLPFPACEVGKAGAVVAWSVARFDEAPPVLNVIDDALPTRRRLLRTFREKGWRGRMVWFPIPLFVLLVQAARYALALPALRRPAPLALWAILRSRRYDATLAAPILGRAVAAHEPQRRMPSPAAAPGR